MKDTLLPRLSRSGPHCKVEKNARLAGQEPVPFILDAMKASKTYGDAAIAIGVTRTTLYRYIKSHFNEIASYWEVTDYAPPHSEGPEGN